MDSRVRRITELVKEYDADLFSMRDNFGVIHVYRKKPRIMGTFSWEGCEYAYSGVENQYLFSVTHNWKFGGTPVEWGIEPIYQYLTEIDSWRDDTGYDEFCKQRERQKEWKKETRKQDFRARAADMRSEFAKATNDIIVQ